MKLYRIYIDTDMQGSLGTCEVCYDNPDSTDRTVSRHLFYLVLYRSCTVVYGMVCKELGFMDLAPPSAN